MDSGVGVSGFILGADFQDRIGKRRADIGALYTDAQQQGRNCSYCQKLRCVPAQMRSTLARARRLATPAVERKSVTEKATASSSQSCHTPSGSCEATVSV